MKRMLVLTVIASFLLVGVSVVWAAPIQGAPTGGKSLYSTRQAYPRPMPHPMAVEEGEIVVPQTEVLVPKRAPEPPELPQKTETWGMQRASGIPEFPALPPTVSESATPTLKESEARPIVKEVETVSGEPLKPLDRPLSGIDVPPSPKRESAKKVSEPASDPISWSSSLIPPTSSTATGPKQDEVLEIDEFNARLAKIQLEKHNLAETLRLIEKIKSPSYKVKTLVDLAEYVSRDSNYKREADQLYSLAVKGIDALAENKPIVVKQESETIRPLAEPETPRQEKRMPTLIQEDKPAALPKAEQPKPEAVKEEVMPETKSETKPAAPPATRRKPLSLIDDVEEEQPKAEQPKPEAVKEEVMPETKPAAPPATRRKPLSLIDDVEEEQPKAEEAKPETKPETKPAAPPATRRKPLSLIDDVEEEQPKTEEAKPETKPGSNPMATTDGKVPPPSATRRLPVKRIDEKPEASGEKTVRESDDLEKVDTPSETTEADKPQRRPMPTRRKIVLEDE